MSRNENRYPLKPCKCGAFPAYYYKIPLHWVECGRANCPYHMRTKEYRDIEGVYDPAARDNAFNEWNRMVKDG